MRTLEHFYIVTGGPAAGKTTLLEELATRGHPHFSEGFRAILQAQTLIGGPAQQGADPLLRAELSLSWDMRSYSEAARLVGPVFCDRGIPDLVAFCRQEGPGVPDHLWRAAREWRYAHHVFVAPPWPEIFETDAERTQSTSWADEVYEPLLQAYRDLDYDLVVLPKVSARERADYVMAHL